MPRHKQAECIALPEWDELRAQRLKVSLTKGMGKNILAWGGAGDRYSFIDLVSHSRATGINLNR